MKRTLLAAALAALLISPAIAAPPPLPDGVYTDEMSTFDFVTYQGDMYCTAKCVSYVAGSITTDLPDIVKHGGSNPRILNGEAVYLPLNGTYASKYAWAADGKWMSLKFKGRVHFTYVIDGGTKVDPICTRYKVAADYQGPFDGPAAWLVKTTVATLPGSCP